MAEDDFTSFRTTVRETQAFLSATTKTKDYFSIQFFNVQSHELNGNELKRLVALNPFSKLLMNHTVFAENVPHI